MSAQPLTNDTPSGNLTGEVDISIDPVEPLPANGTVTISTEGATDRDMSAFPPEGVNVIISSDSVTVTNQTVDIETTEEEEDGTASGSGTGDVSESDGGGTNEGTEFGGASDDDESEGED